ncbi:MAG: hypothetical protein SGILL_006371 [Bacillariaceae sp.]
MAQQGYEQLVNAIIRPPRADTYTINQLGPSEFTFLSQRFRRDDVELVTKNTTHPSPDDNNNNDDFVPQPLKMKASIWTRAEDDDTEEKKQQNGGDDDKRTMVVYLHGNASARVEVLSNLSFLLAQGVFGVCSLDFTGSGKSDGDYVSLGYYERYDLETMLQYLQQTYGNLEIVLWGRSMGASTALMHASHKTQEALWKKEGSTISSSGSNDSGDNETQDESDDDTKTTVNGNNVMSTTILRGLICDSPFASLPLLCEELVEKARSQGLVVPGVIVSVAIAIIARSVRKRAFFDIHEISPIDHAPTLPVPALFVCGADDDFIPPHHSERLIEGYKKGVRTNLFMVPGGHNDPRPEVVFEAVRQFLRNELSLTEDMSLTVPSTMEKSYIRHPPWAYKRNPEIFQAHAGAQPAEETPKPTVSAIGDSTNPEELGMTKERQEDIQNKIHTMLGQASS